MHLLAKRKRAQTKQTTSKDSAGMLMVAGYSIGFPESPGNRFQPRIASRS
jgi:hypothetical protein